MKALLKELLLKTIVSFGDKMTSVVTATTDTSVYLGGNADAVFDGPSNVVDPWLCVPLYARPSTTWGCNPKLIYFPWQGRYRFGVHNQGGTADTVIITWLVCPASAVVGG